MKNWIIIALLIGFSMAQCPNSPYLTVQEECSKEVSSTACPVVRIFGGIDAREGRFPYLVSLQDNLGQFNAEWVQYYRHFCMGTLIANRVVLTSAHCLWTEPNVELISTQNKEGELSFDLYGAIGPYCRHMEGMGRFKVVKYFIHPEYTGTPENGNDLAILVLEEGLLYDDILANYRSSEAVNLQDPALQLTAVGWGAISPEERMAETFLENVRPLSIAQLSYISNLECNLMMTAADQNYTINEPEQICAFNPDSDTCIGDSGGPLLYVGESGEENYQVGITSWGPDTGCAGEKQLPGIYVNLVNFESWIHGILVKIQLEFPELSESIFQVLRGNIISQVSIPDPQLDVSTDSDCLLEVEYGMGEAFIPSYFFAESTGRCVEFGWSGRGSNANNFRTSEECNEICPPRRSAVSRPGFTD